MSEPKWYTLVTKTMEAFREGCFPNFGDDPGPPVFVGEYAFMLSETGALMRASMVGGKVRLAVVPHLLLESICERDGMLAGVRGDRRFLVEPGSGTVRDDDAFMAGIRYERSMVPGGSLAASFLDGYANTTSPGARGAG